MDERWAAGIIIQTKDQLSPIFRAWKFMKFITISSCLKLAGFREGFLFYFLTKLYISSSSPSLYLSAAGKEKCNFERLFGAFSIPLLVWYRITSHFLLSVRGRKCRKLDPLKLLLHLGCDVFDKSL